MNARSACVVLFGLLNLLVQPDQAKAALPSAVAAEAVSENDVFMMWLSQSREVASWRSAIGAARFDVVAARVLPNPTIALAGSYVLQGTPPDGVYNWGPQLSMPLPILGQISGRRDAAVAALRVAEVNVAVSIWQRAFEIQDAMRDRAFADAKVRTIAKNLEELARIESVVDKRVQSGANSSYDVLRVGITSGTLRASLAGAYVERDRADIRLVALVNAANVVSLPVTRASLAHFHGPDSEAALQTIARDRRPDLELARRGIVAAERSATRYRYEAVPVPTVFLGAYFTKEQQSTSVQGGLSFPLPIFDRNQGQVGRAVAEAEGQRTLAAGLEDKIRAEVHGSWQARIDSKRALDEFRAGTLAAVSTLIERAEVSYRAGGSFLIMDLLDAHRAGWDARTQELELEHTFVDAECDLEHAAALVGVATQY